MSEILNDLADEQLVNTANDNNLTSFWLNYGRVPGGEAYQGAGLSRFSTGVPFVILNGVANAKLPEREVESTIKNTTDYFRARGTPIWWWVGPTTQPSDLGKHLQAAGFVYDEDMPGMAVELRDLPETVPAIPGLTIRVVEDDVSLRQWISVLLDSYNISDDLHAAVTDFELRRTIDLPTTPRRYVGLYDGNPVTISALHLDAGVAGLYVVGTSRDARGKGFGAAITLRPMLDARAMGYHVGVLQASGMGFPVYKRLGFKTFSPFGVYLLPRV